MAPSSPQVSDSIRSSAFRTTHRPQSYQHVQFAQLTQPRSMPGAHLSLFSLSSCATPRRSPKHKSPRTRVVLLTFTCRRSGHPTSISPHKRDDPTCDRIGNVDSDSAIRLLGDAISQDVSVLARLAMAPAPSVNSLCSNYQP